MAITIPQISIDEVYISVLKAKLVKNEEGWSKMMPIDHAVRPSGSIIVDALVTLLHKKRLYYPTEVAEYFQKRRGTWTGQSGYSPACLFLALCYSTA